MSSIVMYAPSANAGFYAASGKAYAATSGSAMIDQMDIHSAVNAGWNFSAASSTLGQLIASRRAANIAAHLAGPQIPGAAWATTTVYAAGNVRTIGNGQQVICTAPGTSGASIPVYSATVLSGRPLVDGTVTWYGLPWQVTATAAGAPVVTSGANAAAVGLVETLINVGGAVIPSVTAFSSKQSNNGNAATRHYQFANGPSTGAGNSTADATTAGLSAANVYTTLQWDMEFYITDSKFGITVHNSSSVVYVEVDGVMVQGDPLNSSGTPGWCVAFDYGGVVKRRLVRISDVQVGAQIRGVAMTAQGILEPSDSPNDCMLLLGDSLQNTVVPSLATPMSAHAGFWLKRLLGLTSVVNATVGGAGYLAALANSYNVPAILANAANQQLFASYAPSHIHFSAGFNDAGGNQSQAVANALVSWQMARAQFPNAKITVTDGFAQATGPNANTLSLASLLQAAFVQWNDSNSRFVQAVGPSAASSWTQGNGTAGGALVAGNASNFVSTDGTHSTPAGGYYLATRGANAVKTVWNGLY